MGVRPVHDGDIGVLVAIFCDETGDFGGDPQGFLLRVVRRVACNRRALACGGPQLLGFAPLIVGDDRVGRVENRLRRTIVLLEHDGLRIREILLEILDIADIRATERVNRLVGIADDRHPRRAYPASTNRRGIRLLIGIDASKLADQHVLRVVGVLVLVDENIAELMPVVIGDIRLGTQQFDGTHDQVVEIDGVRRGETMLIFRVDHGIQLFLIAVPAQLVAALAGTVIRGELLELPLPRLQIVLVIRNPGEHRARGIALDVDVQVGGDELDQPLAVLGVVDGETGVQSDGLPVTAKDTHACRMEGGHPHTLGDRANQRGQPLAHFGCSLVGEGDGEDLARPGVELGEDPRDTTGKHTRLAGTGARANQQCRPLILDRLRLLRIEPAKQLLCATSENWGIIVEHCHPPNHAIADCTAPIISTTATGQHDARLLPGGCAALAVCSLHHMLNLARRFFAIGYDGRPAIEAMRQPGA